MRRKSKQLQLISLALGGAALGYFLRLPIGILLGSFIVVAIAQVKGFSAPPFPKKIKQFIQMLIGGFIGLNFTQELLPYIVDLLIPSILAVVAQILLAFLLSFLLTKVFHIDWLTAICGSIPAGMSEIMILSEEAGADVQKVILMHLFRVSLIITVLPVLISFFLKV